MSDVEIMQKALTYLGWQGGTVWQVLSELQKRTQYTMGSDVFKDIEVMLGLNESVLLGDG